MKRSNILVGIILILMGYIIGSSISEYRSNDKESIQNGMNEKPSSKFVANEESNKREVDAVNPYNSSEEAIIELFNASAPSVVSITTSSLQQDRWSMDIFEIPKGSGTGFIWDDLGHIVTNYHVIESGNRFTITLSDQTSYDASVVGTEESKDLAVLRIIAPGKEHRPIPIGKSGNLKIGQSVYAIGNPFGLDQSLTTGIISALGREIKAQNGRPIKDVIQTDAAINPGNSGGPLLDSSGRLIGVNTAIYSPSGASAGIGFSIPVDVVNWVIPDIIEFGEVRRPIMGIELVPNQYFEGEGAMISAVGDNTPADKAGLLGVSRDQNGRLIGGDIIVQINNDKVESNNDLILALEKFKIGDEISVKFLRERESFSTNLKLTSSIR